MAKQAVIDRLTKLGEQTVSQAAEAFSKNKALQDKLETVVKSGLAVKDEVEGNVKVVIDRFNLKNAVDLDGIKTRLDTLESDIESLLGDLSTRVADLTNRVTDLRGRVSGTPVNDEVVATPAVAPVAVVTKPAVKASPQSSLSSLTVKALRSLAAERSIEVPNRIRKADLIALIEAA